MVSLRSTLLILPKQKHLQPKANPFIQSLDVRLCRIDLKIILKMRNYFYIFKISYLIYFARYVRAISSCFNNWVSLSSSTSVKAVSQIPSAA